MSRTVKLAGLSLLAVVAAAALAPAVLAKGVEPRFELAGPAAGPFPSDRFTVPDPSQLTGLRVDLPKPDCGVRPSDCDDIDVLNTLDGFNLQPRLSIPFTGAIDPASVTSQTVFLLRLDSSPRWVGINQVVWDPDASTLHVESNELLDQHARYLLVVTDRVKDTQGDPIGSAQFRRFLSFGLTMDPAEKAYRAALLAALDQFEAAGGSTGRVATASVFTTQSATATLERIRAQLDAKTPTPADFRLGANGERTVFALSDVQGMTFSRQVTTGLGPTFNERPVRLGLLRNVPDAPDVVATIAFGKYRSPDYRTEPGAIPAVGTNATPPVQRMNEVYFNVFLPAGSRPPGGWPVVIAGHGIAGPMGRGNKNEANVPLAVAAKLAQRGLATVAPEIVGHGGGPLGTLTLTKTDGGTVTLPAGGRGFDRNGDGRIGSDANNPVDPIAHGDEGLFTVPGSTDAILFGRDALTQTVVDMIQLVREIEVGIDVDGDAAADLDASRIYYFGSSLGGVYGGPFVALEPSVRAGTFNVPGGTLIDVFRLTRLADRGRVGQLLAAPRVPSLLNGGPDPISPSNPFPFRENLPLRNQPPIVNEIERAIAIQNVIERTEWATQASSPVAYAPHLRKAPLAGNPSRPVLYTFAKGDYVAANPVTSAILRAGDLADRTTYFRYDLAYAQNPAIGTNPHEFAFNVDPSSPGLTSALQVQEQVATFLASDGQETIDPDGPPLPDGTGRLFETPIAGPLPENLCFIPFQLPCP